MLEIVNKKRPSSVLQDEGALVVPPAFARLGNLASNALTGLPGHTLRGQLAILFALRWSGNHLVVLPLRTGQRLSEKLPGDHISVVVGLCS